MIEITFSRSPTHMTNHPGNPAPESVTIMVKGDYTVLTYENLRISDENEHDFLACWTDLRDSWAVYPEQKHPGLQQGWLFSDVTMSFKDSS